MERGDIKSLTNKRVAVVLETERGEILDGYEYEIGEDDDVAEHFMEEIAKRNWGALAFGDRIVIQEGAYLDNENNKIIHCNGDEYEFSSEESAIKYMERMRKIRDTSTNNEEGYLQFNVMPCEDRRFDKYTTFYAFNTKEYWLLNDDRHELMDVPTDVLNELREKFGDNTVEAECYLDKLISEEHPEWLNDIEYIYDGDMEV